MSLTIDPISHPQAWDSVLIGGRTSPGYCEWTGWKRPYEWDKKKGKGAAGETLTFTQLPCASGSFKFYLWESEHFEQWDEFRAAMKYDPTKKAPAANDIYHPALVGIDVNSTVIDSIGAVEHEGKQLYSITIEMTEYRPPPKKSAASTPNSSKGNGGGNGGPGAPTDPIADAQQREIQRLLAEANRPAAA